LTNDDLELRCHEFHELHEDTKRPPIGIDPLAS